MNIKWRFWDAWLKKSDDPCHKCQCRDCRNNAGVGCLMGIDQSALCGKIVKQPAHSDRYMALKKEYDRMHSVNDPEELAVYELLRRAYRAGDMRLIEERHIDNEFCDDYVYVFYSPLLKGAVYLACINNMSAGGAAAVVRIGDGPAITFNKSSLAFECANRLSGRAKSLLRQRELEQAAKRHAEEAAKRARQKQDLLKLLADVRTRQGQ